MKSKQAIFLQKEGYRDTKDITNFAVYRNDYFHNNEH